MRWGTLRQGLSNYQRQYNRLRQPHGKHPKGQQERKRLPQHTKSGRTLPTAPHHRRPTAERRAGPEVVVRSAALAVPRQPRRSNSGHTCLLRQHNNRQPGQHLLAPFGTRQRPLGVGLGSTGTWTRGQRNARLRASPRRLAASHHAAMMTTDSPSRRRLPCRPRLLMSGGASLR